MLLDNKQINSLKKGTVIILFFALFVYLGYLFSTILSLIIISILISMIFNPVVDFIEKKGFARWLAVLLTFSTTGALLFIGFSYFIPTIAGQLNTLSKAISPENINAMLGQTEKTFKSLFPYANSVSIVERVTDFLQDIVLGWINNLSNIFYSLISVVAILVIVPFMTFFMLKDNVKILRAVMNIMPNKYFEVSFWVIKKISVQLSRFVRAWILDAFFVGLMSGLGLAILGINNAASIGFIAGVGHLIPYFGPIIGGIPAIAISLIQFGNFSMLPSIVLLFLIIYTIDNGFIQPNVFSKGTDLHPLVIIILIMAGSELLGVFGMLLAVPAATVLKTAAREIYYGYKNYKIIRV
jgi:predicted PurR-regulated permease PerM